MLGNSIFRKLLLRLLLPVAGTIFVLEFLVKIREWILAITLVAVLLGLVLLYFFSRSFAERIHRLRDFAEGLGNHPGRAGLLPDDNSRDELAELGRSLDQAASRLTDLLDRLNVESSRLQAILSSLVEGVLAVDGELRVTFCNDSFLRAVNAQGPLPELLPLLDLIRDPALLEMLTRVLVTGESYRNRIELSSPEGRAFEVLAAPLQTPSRRGAVAILHDITELERLERVRKDFVANVSHELRTPLTAIQGYTETLLEGALNDRDHNRKFLEIIKAHTIRLNNIASDLLTLSELESGKPPVAVEKVNVKEAMEAAVRAVEPAAGAKGIKLVTHPLPDADVLGHRVRLEQALINLLDNGVKFNQPGGEVLVEVLTSDQGKVRIVIADSGIGIPSQDLQRIFERFYRVDKARSREAGGTGLGLAIVKHIVERMNGTIQVESQLGKGSRFTIHLPCAPGNA